MWTFYEYLHCSFKPEKDCDFVSYNTLEKDFLQEV